MQGRLPLGHGCLPAVLDGVWRCARHSGGVFSLSDASSGWLAIDMTHGSWSDNRRCFQAKAGNIRLNLL